MRKLLVEVSLDLVEHVTQSLRNTAALGSDVFVVVTAHLSDLLLPEILVNVEQLVHDLRCYLILDALGVDVAITESFFTTNPSETIYPIAFAPLAAWM